jgi:hypothetical protein
VIDDVNFNVDTWISGGVIGGGGGYFHSYDLHVIERLWRKGNTLYYQATVEDPSVLVQPWIMNLHEIQLNLDPKAMMGEGPACTQIETDFGLLTDRIRH